jgi:hypothetical protein
MPDWVSGIIAVVGALSARKAAKEQKRINLALSLVHFILTQFAYLGNIISITVDASFFLNSPPFTVNYKYKIIENTEIHEDGTQTCRTFLKSISEERATNSLAPELTRFTGALSPLYRCTNVSSLV